MPDRVAAAMSNTKTTATAIVSVTLAVEVSSSWGGDRTMALISSAAEAGSSVSRGAWTEEARPELVGYCFRHAAWASEHRSTHGRLRALRDLKLRGCALPPQHADEIVDRLVREQIPVGRRRRGSAVRLLDLQQLGTVDRGLIRPRARSIHTMRCASRRSGCRRSNAPVTAPQAASSRAAWGSSLSTPMVRESPAVTPPCYGIHSICKSTAGEDNGEDNDTLGDGPSALARSP